ncbi:hypothetical protein K505DRAFT_74178, partial [Melanomma pulvis-pyrius CBS 109.77]
TRDRVSAIWGPGVAPRFLTGWIVWKADLSKVGPDAVSWSGLLEQTSGSLGPPRRVLTVLLGELDFTSSLAYCISLGLLVSRSLGLAVPTSSEWCMGEDRRQERCGVLLMCGWTGKGQTSPPSPPSGQREGYKLAFAASHIRPRPFFSNSRIFSCHSRLLQFLNPPAVNSPP